ncbi:DUF1127 domain-containing protein [Bradyrhizobium sp. AUGA SZCCT0177]|uniref:DUF1127 domain-containing protein n=1 Tax=Bradyrhizobium sp. AUGA SZCCT0177 TaxID=2807665 RepID=UPI0032DE96E1
MEDETMPCGSTTGNSTNTVGSASTSFPDVGWSWKIPLVWLDAIAMRLERRRQHKQLLELDDHLLADIGMSRTTVEELRRSQLYMMAWRDSR